MIPISLLLLLLVCGYSTKLAAMDKPSTCSAHPSASLEDLRHIAFEAWNLKQFTKAEDCYRDILTASQSGPVPPTQLAGDLHSAGIIASEIGRYAEAEQYYGRELALRDKTNDRVGAGLAYNSLGATLQIEGAFSRAEATYTKAVNLLSRYAGPDDFKTALALNSLGWLYTLWGKTDQASDTLQKAYDAAEKALPADDPALIRFLDVHASFLTTVGRYSEAERLWMRALQIGEKAYPDGDAKFDEVLLHLGQMYSVTGDYNSAERTFQRFLAIPKPPSGPDGVVRAVVTAEIGRIYTQQHRYKNAEQYLDSSVNLMQSEGDTVPVAYSLIRSYFGDYYVAVSKWREAEVQYRTALNMRETMLGKNSPDVALTMFSLAKVLQKLHRKEEAQEYLTQAASIAALQKNLAYSADTVDVRAFRPQ